MDTDAGNKYRRGGAAELGKETTRPARARGGAGGGLVRSDAGNNKLIAGGEGEQKIWTNRERKREVGEIAEGGFYLALDRAPPHWRSETIGYLLDLLQIGRAHV